MVAAGSMITEDVESDDLAIARQRQSIKKATEENIWRKKGRYKLGQYNHICIINKR